MAIRTSEPDQPVPEQYAHTEADSPAGLRQRIAAAEAALTRARTQAAVTSSQLTLASMEQEFGWACWERNGLCFARRPNAPGHDYDVHGDDPADLREAIILAQRCGGREDRAAQPDTPAAARGDGR